MAHHRHHRHTTVAAAGKKRRGATTTRTSSKSKQASHANQLYNVNAATSSSSSSLLFILLIMKQGSSHALVHSHPSSTTASSSSPHQPTLHNIHRIISRKSDGQCTVYTLDTKFGRKHDNGSEHEDDRAEIIISSRISIRPILSSVLHRFQYSLRSTFLPSLPSATTTTTIPTTGVTHTNNRNHNPLQSTNYLRYILYDNIQDLSTSLRSVLATQRILHGVGVGRSGATALSATINFLIRDGCGMLASLLFTSHVSHSFRRDVKKWKYFADIMIDFGITLEILAPSVLAIPVIHGWFLPLLCLGNVCKALCGVAAGACGGALQMYWAVKIMGTEEGISEVAAKSGAQRTLVGGIGLVLSAFLAKWLDNGDVSIAFGLYGLLTAIHLFSNYKALKLVALDWLNQWRLNLVVGEFVKSIEDNEGKVDERVASGSLFVSSPADASKREPLVFLPEFILMKQKTPTACPIRMGVSFNELCRLAYSPQSVLQAQVAKLQQQRVDRYILTVGCEETRFQPKRCILISFFSDSSNVEKAKAYLHASLVQRSLVHLETNGKEEHHLSSDMEVVQKAETIARNRLDRLWPNFERCATNAGWKLDKTESSTEGYEIYFEQYLDGSVDREGSRN